MHCLYFIWELKFYVRKNYAKLEINPLGAAPLNVIQLTLTLKMTTAQVVEKSVTVNNGLIQDYPDDHISPTCEMTPKLKPITVTTVKSYRIERRSVMSRSHDGKISVCQQSCLTETVFGRK